MRVEISTLTSFSTSCAFCASCAFVFPLCRLCVAWALAANRSPQTFHHKGTERNDAEAAQRSFYGVTVITAVVVPNDTPLTNASNVSV
jgi:hypothetical protein